MRTGEGLRSLLIADSYRRVRDGTAYSAVLLWHQRLAASRVTARSSAR